MFVFGKSTVAHCRYAQAVEVALSPGAGWATSRASTCCQTVTIGQAELDIASAPSQ
jgi:hypothetical protein